MELGPDGAAPRFFRPDGRPVPQSPPLPAPAQLGGAFTPATLATWCGERLNLHWAVGDLVAAAGGH